MPALPKWFLLTAGLAACAPELTEGEPVEAMDADDKTTEVFSFSFSDLGYDDEIIVPKLTNVTSATITVGWRQVRTVEAEYTATNASTCQVHMDASLAWNGSTWVPTPDSHSTVFVSAVDIPFTTDEAAFDALVQDALAVSTVDDASPLVVDVSGPFDGVLDFDGPSSGWGEKSFRKNTIVTTTDPVDLALFTGVGTTSLQVGQNHWGTSSNTCGGVATSTDLGVASRITVALTH